MRLKILGWMLLLLLVVVKPALSQSTISTEGIDATVNLSVCGDSVIEGNEDCEGDNLNQQNCVDLGYGGGSLKCDTACEFDVIDCTLIDNSSTTTVDEGTTTVTEAKGNIVVETAGSVINNVVEAISRVFRGVIQEKVLRIFDIDKSGSLETEELRLSVEQWVIAWRKVLEVKLSQLNQQINDQPTSLAQLTRQNEEDLSKCDINSDEDCNLIDLSIILSFIGE